MNRSHYFTTIDPTLPASEQEERAKRQRHAEWGIAVANLGGTAPLPALVAELQLYIDGKITLDELARSVSPVAPAARVYQAVAYREHAAR